MMYKILSLLLLLSSTSFASLQPSSSTTTSDKVERLVANRYIVKLKSSGSVKSISSFLIDYNSNNPTEGGEDLDGNNRITRTFSPKVFNGFSGVFSQTFLAQLKAKHGSSIAYIEKDQVVRIMAPAIGKIPRKLDLQTNPPSWGMTRISQRDLKLTEPFKYPSTAGRGIEAWVVDTGCNADDSDFGGRAQMVKSFIDGEENTDLNGHGTHVSGTIGSKTYGLAKNASIKCVKVLDESGSGTYEGVIAGVEFVVTNAAKNRSVMNMSLGGPKSQALDDAIAAAIKSGIVVVVAAGNEAQDACNVSPAGAPGVLAVGATDRTDSFANFSNTGTCVGILAPGVNITSLWIKGQRTETISGTSMASPHVAGVAALLMGERSFPSAESVYAELKRLSSPNKIKKVGKNTVNKMVFNNAV